MTDKVPSGRSVTMARPGVTKPILDVYEDFQCPACRAFEKSDGAVIQQLADQGKVKVVYYPFTIFSGQPQLANSVRAWAAAKCAPPGRWVKYHNALYANQPAQTTSGGFPVSQLIRLGKDVGIRSVGNPDKLGHVGPVADAWAVAREVNQARRPTD